MSKATPPRPTLRAIFAIIALVAVVVAGNMLVSSLGLGHKTLDLTSDKVHSLSSGTKEILAELPSPVTIRYYATRSTRYMPESLKLHMRRVDDLLSEYQNLAKGKLRIENLDPEPDTDAEDSANLDGIAGQQINDENLYFGLAISCLDQTAIIPFLDPNDETMLEYEVSRRIAEVSATRKPTIGLMSALPITGAPPMMPGQQGQQPWIIYSELKQNYNIEDIGMEPEEIDPEKFNVILVLHPAGISPKAEYQLDQYLLKGGTIIAAVDPFSVTAQMQGGGNPMMGQPGVPTGSSLPKLFEAWGIEMSDSQSVGDALYQTRMQGGRPGLGILTLPNEAMPQKDNVATRDLASVTFFLAGGLQNKGGAGVRVDTLIRSSKEAGLINNQEASQLDPSLSTSFRPDGGPYNLALHLQGKFTSAFPDGDPDNPTKKEEEKDEEKKEDAAEKEEQSDSLTKGTAEGNVFLIADVDAFYDSFSFQVQRLGNLQLVQPVNGNASLLINLIDQAASSTHLIGARSRAATRRPFTVFSEMEAEANQRVGAKIKEFEDQAEEAQERLSALQAERSGNDKLFLSPEQEEEIRNLRAQEVEARKAIRELQKDLRRDKDRISSNITLLNIAAMPALILLLGGFVLLVRKISTRAH